MIGALGSGSNGHCIALNNIRNYLTSSNQVERSKFLVDFSNNDNENIISSEGCFACDMNKANKGAMARGGASKNELSRKVRRGRRLRNRENMVGRKRRHKRNHQSLITEKTSLNDRQTLRKVRKKRYSSFTKTRVYLLVVPNNQLLMGRLKLERRYLIIWFQYT